MNPMRRIRLLSCSVSAVALVGTVTLGWGHPSWWAAPVLAALVTVTELAVVHVSAGRQRWTFSLTEGVIGGAFVLSTGGWAVPAVALGVLVAQLLRRQPAVKVGFNVALFAVSTTAGALTAAALGGGVSGAAAGLGMFFLVNTGLVSLPIALTTRRRVSRVLRQSLSLSTIQEAGTASIGLLGSWLALHAPIGLLGLVVPLALLFLSYDEQAARAAEARLFAELVEGQERSAVRSIDLSAQIVATAAARLFGGADVEIVLVAADGPVRYLGDENGVQRSRVDPTAFDQPWVRDVLGAGLCSGVDGDRPYCSAVLGDPDRPLAVLLARRPAGGARFGRRELELARLLVGQAESWLSTSRLLAERDAATARAEEMAGAARALGDLGAHTTPALLVLRDSAHRLMTLADHLDGAERVGQIIDELHAAERAVASLLGAVALAADPDLVTVEPAGRPAPDRRESEWTTTGVLPPEVSSLR